MVAQIAKWMNILVILFTVSLFIKFYFTTTMSYFYKKKWVIVVCSILVLSITVQIIDTVISNNRNRLPTKDELRSKIAAKNTLVDQDFVYNSSDGYTLVVPAGYAYTTFPFGAISMTAFKNLSPSSMQSGITVSRRQVSEELEYIVTETMKELLKLNPTYVFSSVTKFSIRDKKAFKASLEVVKEGIPVKGYFVFTKAGDKFFTFTMSCPAGNFQQESIVFEKVVQSLRLQ